MLASITGFILHCFHLGESNRAVATSSWVWWESTSPTRYPLTLRKTTILLDNTVPKLYFTHTYTNIHVPVATGKKCNAHKWCCIQVKKTIQKLSLNKQFSLVDLLLQCQFVCHPLEYLVVKMISNNYHKFGDVIYTDPSYNLCALRYYSNLFYSIYSLPRYSGPFCSEHELNRTKLLCQFSAKE